MKPSLPVPIHVTREVARRSQQVNVWLDRAALWMAPPDEDVLGTPANMARRPILLGMYAFLIIFGVFGLWAAIAPLDSAAVSPGTIILDSNRKTIQHLEGGIIEDILVKEGQTVKEGEVLIRLNPTAAQARFDQLQGQYDVLQATEARLIAERDELEAIAFPQGLLDRAEKKEVGDILESQRQIFDSRQAAVKGQLKVLNQRIKQLQEEITGMEAQVASADSQIELLNQEITVVSDLLKKGNALRPRLLALQRTAAELTGRRGEYNANIARANQNIAEAEFTKINQTNDYRNKIVSELKDTQVQLADIQERLRATQDVVKRVEITSPADGIVTGLNVHTVGGVITPGEKLLDIVPTHDKLVVEAQVSPLDIDVVHIGMPARIRLSAYKTRKLRNIEGKVIYVSADRFVDQRSGMGFYTARIEVNEDDLAELKGVELTPGMPADVMIVTGSRTLLSYLVDPLSDAFAHAFREQ